MDTKTSETSPIFVVGMVPPGEQGGWVAITIAPGKKTTGSFVRWERDLEMDLDRLKVLGVTTIIPFLEDDELQGLGIPNLVAAAESRGLAVRRFPFHDVGVPEDMDQAVGFIQEVIDLFDKGERVLMHCNGGLGRAGTMAACLRLALDIDETPELAIESVRNLRSYRAIETREQERFVDRFFSAWGR
jgi:protein-tyrosine phosphatase